jgi:hypothetical protein
MLVGTEGISVQHLLLCRLVSLDEEARTGEKFTDASRGGYDLDRISPDEVERVDLKQKESKDFVVRNVEALLSIRV